MKRKPSSPSLFPIERRALLARLGAATVAAVGGNALSLGNSASAEPTKDAQQPSKKASPRARKAFEVRVEAARRQSLLAPARGVTNGDEERYPNGIASFTKGLPHDTTGEPDPKAYAALVRALSSSSVSLNEVPLASRQRLVNPQAALAFTLEGPDSHQCDVVPAPSFSSAEQAGEMAELYWQALTRDVAFGDYEGHPLIAAAVQDLSRFSVFRGPRTGGRVTARTIFRGTGAGELAGPYLSQFLLRNVPYGANSIIQQIRPPLSGLDYLVTPADWLDAQNGALRRANPPEQTTRFLRSGRDLGEYVRLDFTYQPFLNAALILLGIRAPLDYANPYRESYTETAFTTFGGPSILDLVARVASAALKACWYQKWLVHRRLRPEEFGGRIHFHRSGRTRYEIHSELLNSPVLDSVFSKARSYLLPQAYADGCPLHPAYPSGHAAIAGACTTVLKAFIDESFVMRDNVETVGDCLSLHTYRGGEELRVGGELNKLASNISIGRNFAGIHWRSDVADGLKLGEEVALGVLRDHKACHLEDFRGFSVTRFDGTSITV